MEISFRTWLFERRLEQFGDKIDWIGLSCNRSITKEIVKRHQGKWVWYLLACAPKVPYDFILENYPFNNDNKHYALWQSRTITVEHLVKWNATSLQWENFSGNRNFQFQNVLDYPDKAWNWCKISQHPNVTPKHIIDNPDLPWKWDFVSQNENITLEFVMSMLDKKWYWKLLSCHTKITIEEIISNLQFPWDWKFVSQNPNIRIKHIVDNPTLPWEWSKLVQHDKIKVSDIFEHNELPWGVSQASYDVLYNISFNPNLTLEDIEAHPEIDWSDNFLPGRMLNFNMKWIETFPRVLALYSHQCSSHKNITWQDIKRHNKLAWDPDGLSSNPNIKIKSIYKRMKCGWNWKNVCMRKDFLEPMDDHEIMLYLATKKICNQIFKSWTDPSYKMCSKRLERELQDMN